MPVDVVLGVTTALPSLGGTAPSTLRYFDQAIRRARDARTRPLPAKASVSFNVFVRYVEQTRGERGGSLAGRLSPQFIEDVHHRYDNRIIGMDDALAEIARQSPSDDGRP